MNQIRRGLDTKRAKHVVENTAKKTVKVTISLVKWIFVIFLAYVAIVTLWAYITTGDAFLNVIATASVGGFWAFFFGYFGWRLGQSIEDHFSNLKKKKRIVE